MITDPLVLANRKILWIECWKVKIPEEHSEDSHPILVYERFEACGMSDFIICLFIAERKSVQSTVNTCMRELFLTIALQFYSWRIL